ncbi:collagen-binding domain-containing protein, partial [Ruminococcus sp. Marseille-P328]|uniref:collagen-binding domain-containing protein n=1 Tax=Ruminococcus sp. Marseille-P328 TaxID=1816688 RepID=UPI0035629219
MKKNGYLRRFLALFLALVMIMADSSVTTFAATVGRVRQQNATQKVTPTPGNSNTYRDVLGGAVNYGIVTTRLILGGHIDTNFAAGSLEPDTFADAITTGKYTGENNPGNIIIGDIPNHKYGFWAYSSTKKPFIITTTAEALQYIKKERDYVIYDVDHTKEELQQRVEKLRTGTMSAALADESRYTYYTLSSLLNGDQLDLRSYADGTYYIKVDNSAIISQAEGLKIQLNDKQNIVFYVPDNDVAINKFKINEMFSDRNDLSADPYAKRIIWNIPNATHVKIDNTFGVFLCPNADVDLGGTSSGWVVSKSFHNGGEWHNVWSEQPESIITKTNFCVEKKLAGANIANYAGKFNFVLMDEAGKKIQTKSNDGNGNVVFDDIQFDTAGTYTYYITEKNEQLANIGYDTGKVKVTVVVKTYTNQGNRKVTTIESVVYEKLDKDNNKIEESNVFKNSYNEAASGSLSLEGSKLLTGAALTDGMFEFQLSGDAERTVKNAGTKVDFGTIASWTGTDAKEFTFEVS